MGRRGPKTGGEMEGQVTDETREQTGQGYRLSAEALLEGEHNAYLIRAWYQHEGSPYGDSPEALLRWVQEQLDRLHPQE